MQKLKLSLIIVSVALKINIFSVLQSEPFLKDIFTGEQVVQRDILTKLTATNKSLIFREASSGDWSYNTDNNSLEAYPFHIKIGHYNKSQNHPEAVPSIAYRIEDMNMAAIRIAGICITNFNPIHDSVKDILNTITFTSGPFVSRGTYTLQGVRIDQLINHTLDIFDSSTQWGIQPIIEGNFNINDIRAVKIIFNPSRVNINDEKLIAFSSIELFQKGVSSSSSLQTNATQPILSSHTSANQLRNPIPPPAAPSITPSDTTLSSSLQTNATQPILSSHTSANQLSNPISPPAAPSITPSATTLSSSLQTNAIQPILSSHTSANQLRNPTISSRQNISNNLHIPLNSDSSHLKTVSPQISNSNSFFENDIQDNKAQDQHQEVVPEPFCFLTIGIGLATFIRNKRKKISFNY